VSPLGDIVHAHRRAGLGFAVTLLFIIAVVSVGLGLHVVSSASFKVCVPIEASDFDRFEKTISSLDSVVDLSIKLCTTLIGLGAALLIGLKSGVHLTLRIRLFILVAAIFFIQSVFYAVLWRMGVAELWLNECLRLIAAPRLTSRYDAHLYTLLAGLVFLGLIIPAAMFSRDNVGGLEI
jgi:hypothetical protein